MKRKNIIKGMQQSTSPLNIKGEVRIKIYCLNGNLIMKVVPIPYSLSTSILPE